jgi:integrase
MATFQKPPRDLFPFNAHKDENGEWAFTDLKPDDIQSMDKFLEVMDKRAGSTPLSQVAISPSPADAKINDPGKLSPKARTRLIKMIAEFLRSEEEREKDKDIGHKSVGPSKSRLTVFHEFMGNVHIGSLTPQNIQDYRKALRYYPADRKTVEGMKFHDIVAMSKNKRLLDAEGKPLETLITTTIDGYMQVLRNFLTFCKNQYAVNPTVVEAVNDKKKNVNEGQSIQRRAFNSDELNAIFGSEYMREGYYNCPYQYWIPLLAAFTGARLNELGQLTPNDIKQDKDGTWYIDITDTPDDDEEMIDTKQLKNKESRRIVPVHSKLIELGFIEFAKSQKNIAASNLCNIQPAKADKYGKAPGQWFNSNYLREYLEIADKAVVFHSFRHLFITTLAQSIIDASGIKTENLIEERFPEAVILRRIAGHAVAHTLTAGRGKYDAHTDTYMGQFSMESMARVMNRLEYPNVQFTPYIPLVLGKKRRAKPKKKKVTELTIDQLTIPVDGKTSLKVVLPTTKPIELAPEAGCEIEFEDIDMGKFFK